jgi:hypothetical protein
MDPIQLYEEIKKSFCGLNSYKIRGEVIEILTPFSTLNDKFVSVFIKEQKAGLVVTDGGWIDHNTYENPIYDTSEDIVNKVIQHNQNNYNIKTTSDPDGILFYYKICTDQIASTVFDLANFVVGVVNAFCIQFKDEKEEKERETFRKDANDFLKLNYTDNVKLRRPLDDFKNIRFNAIVNKKSRLYLITYITGSTPSYFENDIRKTIVNFEISEKSKYNEIIDERISIINNQSEGFQPEKSSAILELLSEKTSKAPVFWTEKEKLLELI